MKARFLITDHDAGIMEETRRCLVSRGYEVAVARDGVECVNQLRDAVPTVLVLDPEILWGGGEGVLAWLRDEEPMVPPVVVVADGHGCCCVSKRMEPLIDARIERPNSLADLMRYINQLETLAWWTNAPRPVSATPTTSSSGAQALT